MTKKEAKIILQCRGNGYSEDEFNEALEIAYSALDSSLPSDLDEAAEETSQSAYSEPTADGFAKRSFFKRGFKAGAEWRNAEIQRYFQSQIEQELKRLEDPSYKGPEKDVEIEAELWALNHIQETEHRDITKAFCAGAEWMAGKQGAAVTGDTD